ncbi:hypothetical protein [Devosia psychrophila]|uniref:Uncharacterized protein n=1 Tax=Devosia psychrophila TaxID=728005 RepID=A0A0F5PVD6_9HYPH|nr:hypothetical protein [Devosia psychrophila]KKC32652.1 hypothetical protein WH91_12535 [Devosia psychrophila]SFC51190.1 hypothetical protein SAMN04488059_10662 [Devosia psychrophila]
MNTPEIFQHIYRDLADQTLMRTVPIPSPTAVSPWIAMSLLHKAIRRGRTDFALAAAATLLRDAPDKLWRRLGGAAFEDIGLGNLSLLPLVTAAMAGKRVRQTFGGEWQVASYLVEQLCQSVKCRAADDLLMTADTHPEFIQVRTVLVELSIPQLLDVVIGTDPVQIRALAMWYALGTDRRPSKHLTYQRGNPDAVFNTLFEAGWPNTLVEVCRVGFKRTGEVLAPFVLLLSRDIANQVSTIVPDELADEQLISGVPAWAFDQYSREGKAALRSFLGGSTDIARWIREEIAEGDRLSFLGNLLFRVEGGAVDRRLRWATGDLLKSLAELGGNGGDCADASEPLRLLKADFKSFQEVRFNACNR